MPRRTKNSRRFNRRRGFPPRRSQSSPSQGSSRFVTQVSTFNCIDTPFTMRGANTQPGLISSTNGSSGISVADGTSAVLIDILALGGRFERVVSNFSQWRIARGRIRLRTQLNVGAVANNLPNNQICYGFQKDPFENPAAIVDAVQMGGFMGTVDRMSFFNIGPTDWKFVELPASPTEADVRQCCVGVFYALLSGTATSAIQYGRWDFELTIQCRYPKDQADLHLASRRHQTTISSYISQRDPSGDYFSRAAFLADPDPPIDPDTSSRDSFLRVEEDEKKERESDFQATKRDLGLKITVPKNSAFGASTVPQTPGPTQVKRVQK